MTTQTQIQIQIERDWLEYLRATADYRPGRQARPGRGDITDTIHAATPEYAVIRVEHKFYPALPRGNAKWPNCHVNWYLIGIDTTSTTRAKFCRVIKSPLRGHGRDDVLATALQGVWPKISLEARRGRQGDVAIGSITSRFATIAAAKTERVGQAGSTVKWSIDAAGSHRATVRGDVWCVEPGVEYIVRGTLSLRHRKREHLPVRLTRGIYRVMKAEDVARWDFATDLGD